MLVQPAKKKIGTAIIMAAIVLTSFPDPMSAAGNDTLREERRQLLRAVRDDGVAALPQLIDALDDDPLEVRHTAAHLITHLGEKARHAFKSGLASSDPDVRYIIVKAIERTGEVERHMTSLMTDEDPRIRRAFHLRLLPEHLLDDGKLSPSIIKTFTRVYKSSSEAVRREIINTVSKLPLTDASAELLARARDAENEAIANRADETIIEAKINRLQALNEQEAHEEFLEVFDAELAEEDLDEWPERMAYEALYQRSQANRALGRPEAALEDLREAIYYWPARRAYRDIGHIYRDDLDDPDGALEAFQNAVESDVGFGGHVIHRSILGAAAILRSRGRFEEALEMLNKNSTAPKEISSSYWGFRYLRSYAETRAAAGDYEKAIEYYEHILARDDFSEEQHESAQAAIEELRQKKAGTN